MDEKPSESFERFIRDPNTTTGEKRRKAFAEDVLRKFDPRSDDQPGFFVIANGLFVQAVGCYVYGFYDACAVMLRGALDAAVLYASNYERGYIDGKSTESWSPKPGEFAHARVNVTLSRALMKRINANWGYLAPKTKELRKVAEENSIDFDVNEIENVRELGNFAAHLAEAGINAFAEYIHKTSEERISAPLRNITREGEAKEAIEKACSILCSIKSVYTAMYPANKDADTPTPINQA